MTSPELALGTVQFGMKYGVAGRGEAVPDTEAREILAHAWRSGVRVLDTAPAYGDIETRLAALSENAGFSVVSKISPAGKGSDPGSAARTVTDSIERSVKRLGSMLRTVLFHDGEELLGPNGSALWNAAHETTRTRGIRLGVSCYEPETIARVRSRFPIEVAQIPGNALDQRLGKASAGALDGIEIHLRSVFLQGLLLMPLEAASRRVPAAAQALASWRQWCAGRGLSPLRAALSVVKGLPGVRYCVVGVDRLAQLGEIASEWRQAAPLPAPELALESLDAIDPRRWRTA